MSNLSPSPWLMSKFKTILINLQICKFLSDIGQFLNDVGQIGKTCPIVEKTSIDKDFED